MRELDLMLTGYLETQYSQSDADEKKRFSDLLTWEDDELLNALFAGKEPARSGFCALIAAIRNQCPINDLSNKQPK